MKLTLTLLAAVFFGLALSAGAEPDPLFDGSAPAGTASAVPGHGTLSAGEQLGLAGPTRFEAEHPTPPPAPAPAPSRGSGLMPYAGAAVGAAAGMLLSVGGHYLLAGTGYAWLVPHLLPLALIGAGIGAFAMGDKPLGLGLGGAGVGMIAGAAIGSVVPGIGTFIGAIAGALIGGGGGYILGKKLF